MSRGSALVAWLRRVCLTDYGYNLALPALVGACAVASKLIIRCISFTEIDFHTYVLQAALFLEGERDYRQLDPVDGSGPCVYPAMHLYVYSFFDWLTNYGENIVPAQHVFAALFTANALIVALLYRQVGMPPIALLPLVLSKRVYSIFLLRMFNDPIAILFVYIALYAAINDTWKISAVLFSIGLGIKMNVLLFLPGIAAAAFVYRGAVGAISYVVITAAVQVLISLPFILHDANAYISSAFDFSRVFLYMWTVNWRFLSEEAFLHQHFARGLLAAHLTLLVLFGLFRWTPVSKQGPQWILRNLRPKSHTLTQDSKRAILCAAFTANVIGILCSRSLHYQFYSWYFHQVPMLLWFSKLPAVAKLAVPVALEWSWNVFPSTQESSMVLLACNVLIVLGCFTLPGLAQDRQRRGSDAEEKEVDSLLAPQQDTDAESEISQDETAVAAAEAEVEIEAETKTERRNAERQASAAKEAKERAAFQRRIATRRRLLGLLGRGSLLLRPLLVLAAIVLMFVVPHPMSPVSRGTYVDENALQPGQAKVYWDYFDVTYADMLSEKVGFLSEASSEERANFVFSELQSYGLEVNRQDYKFDALSEEEGSALVGTNVYARSATPRIDGREAVVLTASWRSRWKGENDPFAPPTGENTTESTIDPNGRINVRGVVSILALARYLSTQAHLSKDLIFVISDGYLEGIHAWSSAYFGSIPDGLTVDPVRGGGSQVWNAISIDYPADSFDSLIVQYEGFDGQLPNMDVINTIVRVIDSVAGGLDVRFGDKAPRSVLKETAQDLAKRVNVSLRSDVEYELWNYENGLRAAARQVGFGVTGQASGPHGVFQRHHVDAVTLFAVPATGPYGFLHMGRMIESFVRSMSNLLERLHHSQFFYLLLNRSRFAPIGTVILVPLFVSIALTIAGLAIWFGEEKVSKMQREDVLAALRLEESGEEKADVPPETPTLGWYRQQALQKLLEGDEGKMGVDVDRVADRLRESMRPVGMAVACVGSTVVMGAGVLYRFDALAAGLSGLTVEDQALITSASSAFLLFPLVIALLIRSQRSTERARRIGSLLHSFAYLQAGMLTAVLSVLNFALATALALSTYADLRIASGRPTPNPTSTTPASQVLRGSIMMVFNPVLWAMLNQVLEVKVLGEGVKEAVRHWRLFDAATVPIVCLAYVPIILQAQMGVWLKL